MITEDRMRVLLAEANPIPDEAALILDERKVIAHLAILERRSSEVPQQSPRTNQPSRYRGPAWAAAAFVAVLAVAALYVTFADDTDEVADNSPPPTTVAPDVETMTDLEIIEAGVAALYSGDADRAVELFDMPAPNDDAWIRSEAPYQAAVGGRLTLDCRERATPGVFTCHVPYANVFTDAIGWVDSSRDTLGVAVEDGAITEFGLCQPHPSDISCPDGFPVNIFTGDRVSGFPTHYFIDEGLSGYLNEIGYGNPDCVYGRYGDPNPDTSASIECLQVVLDDLDGWATWAKPNLELP